MSRTIAARCRRRRPRSALSRAGRARARRSCGSRSRCARSRFTVRRAGRRLLRAGGVWVADGRGPRPLHPVHRGGDRRARSCAPAERALPRRGRRARRARTVDARGWRSSGGRGARLRRRARRERPRSSLRARGRRAAAAARARLGPALRGALGRARRPPLHAARPGRADGPARRRPPLHRSRLPAGDARRGRDPAGRLRAGAVAAVEPRLRRSGARPTPTAPASTWRASGSSVSTRAERRAAASSSCCAHRTPAARLRAFCRLTGFPALLPEWGYGFWKSRDVHEHQDDVLDDFDGFRRARDPARRDRDRLAVGDPIQHLGVQPAPVPGRARG